MVAAATLLRYPDLNKEFVIKTDASGYQLGAVTKQDSLPIAFYSRKLTGPQRKCSTIEKELLSVLEVLEEQRLFLWGCKVKVLTDHKNLSFDTAKSTRVQNWRLLVEDFNPEITYLPDEKNIEAHALNRYPIKQPEQSTDDAMEEAMLNYPTTVGQFPAQLNTMRYSQQQSPHVMALMNKPGYQYRTFGGHDLVCKEVAGDWKIVLTGALIQDVIEWYHIVLNHAGVTQFWRRH